MTAPPRASTAGPVRRRSTVGRDVWCGLFVVLLAAAVRGPRLSQSLWYDEMTTLVSYVLQPWPKVVAAHAGQYVPNNHVLHTVLVKLLYPAADPGPPREALLRVPAWVAGSLLPVAMAWPLRRQSPAAALGLGVVVAVHPWLVAVGAEAGGYTLMLLLGVVATNLLPDGRRRWPLGYAAAVAGTIYTVPLGVLLVPAHAVAVAATRRAARPWAVGVALGLSAAAALYLPMARGLAAYYRHPYPQTMTYGRFVDALPRHALAGERLPRPVVDPLVPQARPPDPAGSSVYWALPVLVVIVGSTLGWSRYPDARPMLASLAAATLLGGLLPLLVPAATEVRFDTWAAPWFSLAVVLLLSAAADTGSLLGRSTAVAGLVVLVTQLAVWDARWLPNQPVREAMRLANGLVPRGRPIVVAYLGATEATFCYAADAPDHAVVPAPDADTVRSTLALLDARTGRLPWLVIPFEDLARDREPHTPAGRAVWRYVADHYRPVARLPGRLSSVAIYAPVDRADFGPVVDRTRGDRPALARVGWTGSEATPTSVSP